MKIKPYIEIARVDHWFKNIFMLPGIALALVFTDVAMFDVVRLSIIAVLSTCFIASANYVINEWLDRDFDQHHPIKKNRPSAVGDIKVQFVYIEYSLLVAIGLGLASFLTTDFVVTSLVLLVMGLLYNVRPFRTKDRIYLDVLSESINNPLRLLLGWSALISGYLPPSSIMLAYWMGGAYLMAIKRFAEYRFIGDPERAGLYRRSFKFYSEEKLLLSSIFYGMCSAFFLAIFLIKYRVEFLLSFPLFAVLFVWYLHIGLKPTSAAQTPEKLYQEKSFVAFVAFLAIFVAALFFIDIPFLSVFIERIHY